MDAHRRLLLSSRGALQPPPPQSTLWPWSIHPSAKLFLDAQGRAVRYLGLSHFRGLDRFGRGERAFGWIRRAFPKVNVLRVWPYVEWNVDGWDAPPPDAANAFVKAAGAEGYGVELTLLTSNQPRRILWARDYVRRLADAQHPNLLLEAGNEPDEEVNNIAVEQLYTDLIDSGYLWTSGRYATSAQRANTLRGRYGVAHTPREYDFARHGHQLIEYFNGSGPDVPHNGQRTPWLGDEPIRPDQTYGTPPAGTRKGAWKALGGAYALFGGGGTFHYEGGKQAVEPTGDEQGCADAYFEGLTTFPADAVLGSYTGTLPESPRVAEGRTYPVGEWMVRAYASAPEPPAGWVALEPEKVLCRRG